MQLKFTEFLLNENRAYLGEKIGDVLSSVDDLQNDGAHMGARQLVKFSEKIVSRIRRILHSNWPQSEMPHLEKLQKVAVNIMKGIDEKQDLKSIFPSVQQELQQLMSNLGVPVNQLGNETGEDLPDNPPPGEAGKEKGGEEQQGQEQGPNDPAQMQAPNPAELGGPPPPPPVQPPNPTAGPAAPAA